MPDYPRADVGSTADARGLTWYSIGKACLATLQLALGVAWMSTPYWWWIAAVTAAPFFGETPSPAEIATAQRYMLGALLCAFAAPSLGLLLAAIRRRRLSAVLFGVALVLSIAAGVLTGLFTPENLRELQETDRPQPTPTETDTRSHCMELSGGDNECPGG